MTAPAALVVVPAAILVVGYLPHLNSLVTVCLRPCTAPVLQDGPNQDPLMITPGVPYPQHKIVTTEHTMNVAAVVVMVTVVAAVAEECTTAVVARVKIVMEVRYRHVIKRLYNGIHYKALQRSRSLGLHTM